MTRRRSEDGTFLVLMVAFAFMAFASGVLLWAIAGGVVVTGVVYGLTRERKTARDAGVLATAVISAFGVASMLSPGWYQSLL